LDAVGWYNGNSGGALHEVSKKQANELGIYDMSGNLWEWCLGPDSQVAKHQANRGGNYGDGSEYCPVVSRLSYGSPMYRRSGRFGFRVALSSVP
jgi:formylglycine-generating enzyme required for sulfatase activity